MYSSISKHDNINYGRKLSNLHKSTLDYSSMGTVGSRLSNSPTSRKIPTAAIAAVVVMLSGGAFAYYTFVHKKKKGAPQNANQRQRAPQNASQRQRAPQNASQRQQIKPKSKSRIFPVVGGLLALAAAGGGVWFFLRKKQGSTSVV
jgi:flagellar basal body-associated protein FliL